MSDGTILLWGGSVRSAAQAARRLGERPVCVDWFGDVDTRACGPVVECRDWEGECADVLGRLSGMRGRVILPLGGTENFPVLHAKWAAFGRVAGASIDAIRLVRDPQWVAGRLRAAGLPTLRLLEQAAVFRDGAPGEWLRKPRAGVAGRGIGRWNGGPIREEEYLQEYRAGESVSAGFLADNGCVELLGVTRQLIGTAYGTGEFGYAGNVLWADCPADATEVAQRIGEILACASGLSGLFGVDGVLDRDEAGRPRWWVCEVNPRPTAAMELWERGGRELLREHLAATVGTFSSGGRLAVVEGNCDERRESSDRDVKGDGAGRVGTRSDLFRGKRIVYAREPSRAEGLAALVPQGRPFHPEWVADLPEDGMVFRPGDPICTVLAEAESHAVCAAELDRLADVVRSRFVRADVSSASVT